MRTKPQIIAAFYVLARDSRPPHVGVRYGNLAPLWFDMAVHVVCGRAAARVDRLKDVQATRVLAHMVVLQREHEGQISAQEVARRIDALGLVMQVEFSRLEAARPRWRAWVPLWLQGALTSGRA